MNPLPTPDAMDTALHLLLLPERSDAAAISLHVDGSGRILARRVLGTDATIARPAPTQPASRQVLAVPGSGCLARWLRLPARNPVQALAAARVLVADSAAAPTESLHLAIAPLPPAGQERLVVALEPAQLQRWLDRAATLGMTPDAVVPMPLLLPISGLGDADDIAEADTDAEENIVGTFDGQWLVRGRQLAFAGEPALAERIAGERPRRHLDAAATEASLAIGALSPPVDLLQYAFANTPPRREGWPAWRRAAILAGVLAASPLLMLAAQAIGHESAARDLQAQARAQAQKMLPDLAADADPLPAVHARLAALQAGDRFAHATGTLLSAVAAVDGAELDALAWADGNMQATLVLAAPAGLGRIRGALAGAGLEMSETGTTNANGRIRHDITIRPRP